MPTPPRDPVRVAEFSRAVAVHGTRAAAAKALGVPVSTLKSALDAHPTQPAPVAPQPVADKPRIRVKAWTSATPPEGPVIRVVAIGDAHDKPGRCKKRFAWLGRFAADMNPDAIVSIGDWASLDSLSTHEVPGSANDAERPPFFEELESLDESLSIFDRELLGNAVPRYHTHGNHEYRAWRAATRQPKINGDMPVRLEQVFARYLWNTRPFG
ncbi:MAG: metallophosphoesterase, partial [bacterium]|nr:metallophosphoesterase [bacterium]